VSLGQKNVWELAELRYVAQFGFYALKQNFQHVPEWLEEAIFNSQ
jgi:hypothetical protein